MTSLCRRPSGLSCPICWVSAQPRLIGYTPESAIAEKFQAMVGLDLTNTRIKDFYDVWRLSRTHEFEGATLAKAIETTFTKRSTALPEKLPRALTEEFSEDAQKQSLWLAFLRKGRLCVSNKINNLDRPNGRPWEQNSHALVVARTFE